MEKFNCIKCGKCCNQFDSHSGGLMIFEWEKEKLEKLAKKNKINFKIEPTEKKYDSKSNTLIIAAYGFKEKSCPFLTNNQCSIYQERPFYCHAFPLSINQEKNKFKLEVLQCKNSVIPENNNLKEYYEIYGEIFLHALEIELFRHTYEDIINTLKNKKAIKVKKESKNAIKKSLFEFLNENNFLLRSDTEKIIQDIINLKNAKSALGLF